MIGFFNTFTKVTGWIVQKICFRTKVYYEDKRIQGRRIKGAAIIVSNHTSVFDYAVFLFVFWSRTLRYQMAEVLFQKKLLALFLKCMGGIYIDRNSHDFEFMSKCEKILKKGGVVGIFPEGRLPNEGEQRPLQFQVGAAQLALMTNVPVIPVYTNGSYFSKKKARVIIGKPICVADLISEQDDYKTNLQIVTAELRKSIIELGSSLSEMIEDEKRKK